MLASPLQKRLGEEYGDAQNETQIQQASAYLLDEGGCRQVEFEETEHFRVTRDYLLHYKRRLEQLLTDTPLLDALEEDDEDCSS